MNVPQRAAQILFDPADEWARVEKDTDDFVYLMTRYVAALVLM